MHPILEIHHNGGNRMTDLVFVKTAKAPFKRRTETNTKSEFDLRETLSGYLGGSLIASTVSSTSGGTPNSQVGFLLDISTPYTNSPCPSVLESGDEPASSLYSSTSSVYGSDTSEKPSNSVSYGPITCDSLFVNKAPFETPAEPQQQQEQPQQEHLLQLQRQEQPKKPQQEQPQQPQQTQKKQQPQLQHQQPQLQQQQTQPQLQQQQTQKRQQPHQQQLQQLQQQWHLIYQQQQLQQLQQLQQRHLIYLQQQLSPVGSLVNQSQKLPVYMPQPRVYMDQPTRSRMGQPDSSGQAKRIIQIRIHSYDGIVWDYSGEVGANNLPDGKGIFRDKFGYEYSGRFFNLSSVDSDVKRQIGNKIEFGKMVNGKFKPDGKNYTKL